MQSLPIGLRASLTSSLSLKYHSHVHLLRPGRNRPVVRRSSYRRPRRQLCCSAAYFWQQYGRGARSGVQDAQEKALAAADKQAKQELYEQLLDRQLSSRSTEVSTSEVVHQAEPAAREEQTPSTELIFRLERRGEGWGEEIFPHLVIEHRPIKQRDRNRSCRPAPWAANRQHSPRLRHSPPVAGRQARNVCMAALGASSPEPVMHALQQEGSAEQYLLNECGIEKSRVDGVMKTAVAWRVTAAGRELIDRRRRSRVERNLISCAEYLVNQCGIEPGSNGVGQIFLRVPQIMLCKPSANDRWDRRVVQLAAFMHRHGHCTVPENYEDHPDLDQWVQRQRVARSDGTLTEERLQVLYALGFEFGEVALITEEWENRFDQLLEWLLCHGQNEFNWLGLDWGEQGGLQARQLAMWVQLQREFWRRNVLDPKAVKRLDAIGFVWDPVQERDTPQQRHWMKQLGKLLYIVERNCKINAAMNKEYEQHQPAAEARPYTTSARQTLARATAQTDHLSSSTAASDSSAIAQQASAQGTAASAVYPASRGPLLKASRQPASRGFPPPYPSRYSPWGSRVGPSGGQRQPIEKGANALQRQTKKRRDALATAQLEAGQGYWLAKQRWLWRHQRLPREQFYMLQLAGVEMDVDSPQQWKQLAHETAHYLTGAQIYPEQTRKRSKRAPTAATSAPHAQSAAYAKEQVMQKAAQPLPSQPHHISQSSYAPRQLAASSSMYTAAHATHGATIVQSPIAIQRSQMRFQKLSSYATAASTRTAPTSEPAAAVSEVKKGASLYASKPPGRPAGRRCAVRRWVLTQRALWHDSQLTAIQRQYMNALGVTWLLSDKVVHMEDSTWRDYWIQYRDHLATAEQHNTVLHGGVNNWLVHQQGLYALGYLQPRRVQRLQQLGFAWQPKWITADMLWDARVSELVAFKRRHGHVKVSSESLNDETLSDWLSAQTQLLVQGQLPSAHAAQLLSLGVEPDQSAVP